MRRLLIFLRKNRQVTLLIKGLQEGFSDKESTLLRNPEISQPCLLGQRAHFS